MNIIQQTEAFHVAGIELRTSNIEAAQTIPPHWQRFQQEGVLERLPNKLSGEVYAVYTHFENQGLSNEGTYSLVLGAKVRPSDPVPAGMTRVEVPAGPKMVFPVEAGRFDLVGQVWQSIWNFHEREKTFIAEYERYSAAGGIDIFIGIRD